MEILFVFGGPNISFLPLTSFYCGIGRDQPVEHFLVLSLYLFQFYGPAQRGVSLEVAAVVCKIGLAFGLGVVPVPDYPLDHLLIFLEDGLLGLLVPEDLFVGVDGGGNAFRAGGAQAMAIFGALGVDLASGCEEVEEVFAVGLGLLEDIEAGVGFV